MQIKEIYKKFHTPKHIISHMKTVKLVCEMLVYLAKEKKIKVDEKSLYNAAIIHDAARVCDFKELNQKNFPYPISNTDIKIWEQLREQYGNLGHNVILANYLNQIGESVIANLVLKHDFKQIQNLNTIEEKLLYYADKRVEQDDIVTLQERLEKGDKRNGKKNESQKEKAQLKEAVYKLELELEELLGKGIYELDC